jgi:HK97 family phage major capsid protein
MSAKQIPGAIPIQRRAAKIAATPKDGERLSGADPGRFDIALSSESPVRQYFGNEVLKHGKGNIRTQRLDEGMVPLLFNHDFNAHIGAVDGYQIKDGMLRVQGPFSNSPLGQEKRRDYDDGILKAASAGYRIHKMVRTEDEDNPSAPDDVEVTDWEPYDASLVTVPADPTVGQGRTLGKDEFPVEIETRSAKTATTRAMECECDCPECEDDNCADCSCDNCDCEGCSCNGRSHKPQTHRKQEIQVMAETAVVPSADAVELRRTQEILAVATDKDFSKYVTLDEARKAIAENVTADKFKDGVTRKIIDANDVSKVGTAGDAVFGALSRKEQKRYSVIRMVRSLVNEAKRDSFSTKDADAGFEREVSDEIKRSLKIQTNGPLVPNAAYRSLGTATIASGAGQIAVTSEAATVQSITSPEVIELLRHRPRVVQLGARTLGGLQGIIRLPRQTAANTAYWVTEGASVTPSDLTTDFLTLTPRRISQQTSWTIELLAEASPDIEALARMDLDKVRNIALDLAAISGTGTGGQPTGIMNTSGLVLLSPSGTAFSEGGKPLTFADVVAYESAVAAADADVATSGWLFTPEVRASLKTTAKFPAGYAVPIWDDGPKDPLGLETGPLGYRAGVTNQLSKTGTKAGVTGSILHNSIFGDFSQLIMADWGASEIVVDPYTQAGAGAVVVTARSLHDNAVRHIAAFVANPYIAIS